MSGFFESLGKAIGEQIDVNSLAKDLFVKVEPWAETKANEVVDKYTPVFVEKLLALLPTLAASAAKVAVEKAFEHLPDLPNIKLPDVGEMTKDVVQHVLDSDPDLPGLSDIVDVSEIFRKFLGGK